jgi:hypothetical protein
MLPEGSVKEAALSKSCNINVSYASLLLLQLHRGFRPPKWKGKTFDRQSSSFVVHHMIMGIETAFGRVWEAYTEKNYLGAPHSLHILITTPLSNSTAMT